MVAGALFDFEQDKKTRERRAAEAMPGELIVAITALMTAIIGGFSGFYIERWRNNRELDRVYLAPFRKWCAEFYDELRECTERYLVSQIPCGQYSKIQVIDDWRALHDISTYGRGWLAKIRKENKEVAKKLEELLTRTDEFWHRLETNYQFVLENRIDIVRLGVQRQNDIAREICNQVTSLLQRQKVNEVLEYLEKKIP